MVSRLEALETIEMHDFLCCRRLLETPGLAPEVVDRIGAALGRLLETVVATDPGVWQRYGLRPLQVATSPGSPFVRGLEDAVATNLDTVITTQQDDGSWQPTWSWGEAWPEVWEQARQEWAGILTLETLLTLERFSRIEDMDRC